MKSTQHNPGRGCVFAHKVPPGSRLVRTDTNEEVKHWTWADLDAGEVVVQVTDAHGNLIPTGDGKAIQSKRERMPVILEGPSVKPPKTPAVLSTFPIAPPAAEEVSHENHP